MINAAQSLVTNGIATADDIDRTILKLGAPLGTMGIADLSGLGTVYNILAHWVRLNRDAQMSANAQYLWDNFVDRGRLSVPNGGG